MEKFEVYQGLVVPLDRENVDTDAIIPKQFLKSIARTGFGQNLFDEWRYLDIGEPGQDCSTRPLNPDFVLNQERYQNASVLLARSNFGCGSSREHAPWALIQYGFRVIIASSFADIFFNNCYKNGLLPIALDMEQIDYLFSQVYAKSGYQITIDLPGQKIITPEGDHYAFEITPFRKKSMLEGLDEIGLTLQHADKIHEFEKRHFARYPWLKQVLSG